MLNLTPDEFFDLTPYEINLKIKAFSQNHERFISDLHFLGMLVSVAVNSPKDYPKLENLLKKHEKQIRTDVDEEIKNRIKNRLMRLKHAWRTSSGGLCENLT